MSEKKCSDCVYLNSGKSSGACVGACDFPVPGWVRLSVCYFVQDYAAEDCPMYKTKIDIGVEALEKVEENTNAH